MPFGDCGWIWWCWAGPDELWWLVEWECLPDPPKCDCPPRWFKVPILLRRIRLIDDTVKFSFHKKLFLTFPSALTLFFECSFRLYLLVERRRNEFTFSRFIKRWNLTLAYLWCLIHGHGVRKTLVFYLPHSGFRLCVCWERRFLPVHFSRPSGLRGYPQ